MADKNQKPHAAVDAGYKIGDYAIFGGYQALPEGGDEILKKDDPIKIVSFDDNGLDIIVVKVDESGEEIVDDKGEPVAVERVYVEEMIRAAVAEVDEGEVEEGDVEEGEAEADAEPEGAEEPAAEEAVEQAAPAKKAAAKKTPAKKAAKATEAKKAPAKKATETKAEEPTSKAELVVAPSVREILAQTDALAAAKSLVDRAEQTDFTLGGVLANIQETGVYKDLGYNGKGAFDNYVKSELSMDKRKAYYLIAIYTKFTTLNIAESQLAEIGWSKIKELARVSDEILSEKFDELRDYAKANPRDALITHLKTNYAVASRGQSVKMVTFSFRLAEEEAEAARTAITEAQAIIGEQDPSKAFAYIVNDWRNAAPGSDMTLDDFKAMAEAKFGVTLAVVEPEAGEEAEAGELADAEA